ncbi:hypothetical protein B0H10DRAFT_2429915 [Mycena sp. CBHHK59/15]|nr:hypothetical protein B0H10DRAFT_2429915 [Mycena sp. CBHHK59/15]
MHGYNMTLLVLFGEAEKPRQRKPSAQVMEEEEVLMQALAEADEDEIPDDGAVEIGSEDDGPRTPLPAHDPDSTALSLACPLDDLLSGRVARTSANAPFIGLRQLLLCINKFSSPSAPTPCLEARACIPAACRPHCAQCDRAQVQPLFDRLASRTRRPPHDTPWQTDRSAAPLQRRACPMHTLHAKDSVSGKPVSMKLNWESHVPTCTTTSHSWPPDARTPRQTRVRLRQLVLCSPSWRDRLRAHSAHGSNWGRLPTVLRPVSAFFAIAVVVALLNTQTVDA